VSFAQTTPVYNKLINADTLVAYYTQTGEPVNNIRLAYNQYNEEKPFLKDVIYVNKAGERLIYITTKLISSTKIRGLKAYYCIMFEGYDSLLNVRCGPMTLDAFNKSLLSFRVIHDDTLDKQAISLLMSKWRKKPGYVTGEELDAGTSCNYNFSQYTYDRFIDTTHIKIRENKIYSDSTLFASFSSYKMAYATIDASKEDLFYKLLSPSGVLLAEICIVATNPFVRISSPYYSENLYAFVPVREEKRLLIACTKILEALIAAQ